MRHDTPAASTHGKIVEVSRIERVLYVKLRLGPACLFVVMALCGCGKSGVTRQAVEGVYAGQFPSGLIETWELKPDGSFHQSLYRSGSDFHDGALPGYSHDSKWEIRNGELWVASTLQFYKFSDPQKEILDQPVQLNHATSQCWLPKGYDDHRPLIVISGDTGYILSKLTYKQDSIRRLGWH